MTPTLSWRNIASTTIDASRSPPRTARWHGARCVTVSTLVRLCSLCYEATVGNDNAVRLAGNVFDIPPGPSSRSFAGRRVEIRQFLDDSWRIYFRDALIATAAPTTLGHELRALRHRKLSKASKAFREVVLNVER